MPRQRITSRGHPTQTEVHRELNIFTGYIATNWKTILYYIILLLLVILYIIGLYLFIFSDSIPYGEKEDPSTRILLTILWPAILGLTGSLIALLGQLIYYIYLFTCFRCWTDYCKYREEQMRQPRNDRDIERDANK